MNTDTNPMLAMVAEEYGVTIEEIKGRSREQPIADARMMAVYLIFRKYGYTITTLAKMFNRTHPTILYSINRIKELKEYDRKTKFHINNLCSKHEQV